MPFVDIHCPYCGEPLEIFVDDSAGGQRYIEDCQVCCRPIDIAVTVDEEGGLAVHARAENDA
jgi:Cysteine-rich CPXCG